MDTMKKIMFAPMTLTKTLFYGSLSTRRTSSDHVLLDDTDESLEESPVKPTDYSVDDNSLGSLISLELCLNIMHINKESLGRALVITSAIDESQM